MKMIMQSTNVRLPNAPIVRPIIEMSKFRVGQDFANLNTRSCSFNQSIWVLDFVHFGFDLWPRVFLRYNDGVFFLIFCKVVCGDGVVQNILFCSLFFLN